MEQEPLIPEVIDPVRPRLKPNNGNGRPKGARNHRHAVLEKLAHAHSITLMERLICEAEAGDMFAMKIILDRIWPKPKGAPINVGIPQTQTPSELRMAMHDALARVASGEISTDDGAALVSMMKDILAAHSVTTMLDAAAPGQAQGSDGRALLAERLARLIESRRVESLPQNGEPDQSE